MLTIALGPVLVTPVFLHRPTQPINSQPQHPPCGSVWLPIPSLFPSVAEALVGGCFFIAAPGLSFLARVPQLAPGCVGMGNVFSRGTCLTSSSGDPHVHDQDTPFLLRQGGGESAGKQLSPADGLTRLAWPDWMRGSEYSVQDRGCWFKF